MPETRSRNRLFLNYFFFEKFLNLHRFPFCIFSSQFFTDRSYHLAQIRYLLMLRWRRFCRHASVIEKLYPHYKVAMCKRTAWPSSVLAILKIKKYIFSLYFCTGLWLFSAFYSVSTFNQSLKIWQISQNTFSKKHRMLYTSVNVT